MAQGNKVAMAVETYLTTGKLEPIVYRSLAHHVPQVVDPAEYAQARRARPAVLPPAWRSGGFVEVEMGFDEATAQAEAKRCLRCDLEELESAGQAASHAPSA